MSNRQSGNRVVVDNPITKQEQDLLGRTAVARSFVRQVLDLDASLGIVAGVFSPWGSGKTSFLNLARQVLDNKDIPVIEFNPWMFSGAEQLVDRFFTELHKLLKPFDEKIKEAGKFLSDYGTCLQGNAGILFRVGSTFISRRRGPLAKQRKKLVSKLRCLEKPIVILLDDVDRLSTAEIREIFKLVRLTACFPNLVYIVACDRERVEEALGQTGLDGRRYLEKIVQYNFNLPETPQEVLHDELSAAISSAMSAVSCTDEIDEQDRADVFPEIILPLIRNMRDVRRYSLGLRDTLASLDAKVALIDVLALEAVRLFLPGVFDRLSASVGNLTVASLPHSIIRQSDYQIERARGSNQPPENQYEILRKAAGSETGERVVNALLDRLFPARQLSASDGNISQQPVSESAMLDQRRVAHESILRLYLERSVDSELRAFQNARDAFEHMTDLRAFEEFMAVVDPVRLEAVIGRIEDFKDQFRADHVEVGITGILNLWRNLPRRLVEYDAIGGLTTVVQSLLETLDSGGPITDMVRRILPRLNSLSSKWILVRAVGFQPRTQANFVSKEDSEGLYLAVGNAIRSANGDDLLDERNPAKLLRFARGVESEYPLHIDSSPKLTYLILSDSLTESRSGTMRSRAQQVSYSLDWNQLAEVFGSSETLQSRIEALDEEFADMITWLEEREISLDEARFLVKLAKQGEHQEGT